MAIDRSHSAHKSPVAEAEDQPESRPQSADFRSHSGWESGGLNLNPHLPWEVSQPPNHLIPSQPPSPPPHLKHGQERTGSFCVLRGAGLEDAITREQGLWDSCNDPCPLSPVGFANSASP